MSDVDRRAVLAGLASVGGVAAIAGLAHGAPPDERREPTETDDGRCLVCGATETITIVRPGSYVMTGDVCVSNGRHGIVIDSDGVTLDLNGYSVRSEHLAGYGVMTGGSGHTAVTVRNGTISGFLSGVYLGTKGNPDSWVRAEDLVVHRAGAVGVQVYSPVTGGLGIVRRCTVWQTGLGTSPVTMMDSAGVLLVNVSGAVEDCIVMDVVNLSPGFAAYGVSQYGGTDMMVVNNRVTRCATGLKLHRSRGVVYRDNIVTGAEKSWDAEKAMDGGGNVG